MQRCPQSSEGTYTYMILALFEKTFVGNCGTDYNTHEKNGDWVQTTTHNYIRTYVNFLVTNKCKCG